MSSKNTQNIADKLAKLQQRYYDQLPEKLQEIEVAWQGICNDAGDPLLFKNLLHYVHTLFGSAGTFGAVELSAIAKQLDQRLKLELAQEQTLSEEAKEFISHKIELIKEQVDVVLSSKDKNKKQNWFGLDIQKQNSHNLVYVVDDDELTTKKIAAELELIKFKVVTFNNLEVFFKVCEHQLPAVIIMDVVFPDESDTGVQAIQKLQDSHPIMPPVIFISAQTSIDTRLAASRVGALRFFEKPLDYDKLRTSVENLSVRNQEDAYRVLIVDDSVVMAEYYATVLKQVGIDTRIINYPLTILDALENFHPDLILMDLHMPECNGIELASVIRQDDKFTHTAIVFLSAETEQDIQLSAINTGADDFITKPAKPDRLILTVMARVKRARWLYRINTDLQALIRDNQYQQTALDSHSIVSIADASGNIIYVNDKFVNISGYSREELIGHNHRLIKSGDQSDAFFADMWQTISSGNIWSGEIKNRSKEGGYYWVESTIVPFMDDNGIPYKYVSIRTDITAVMKIQEELFDAKERAESASRAKSEFLSSMSHELRTPLNAILGFSQILLIEKPSNQQKDQLNEIVTAGNHLLALINDVLDLARIESDRLSISIEPVSLCEIIDECRDLVVPMVTEKNIIFEVNQPEDGDVIVSADRLRLKQVLLNLLSNAIKYNHENGRVKLYCQKRDHKIRLFIEDNGIGIAREDFDKLFKPFQRLVDNTYGIDGTGIGLVITQRLMDHMGGAIGVDSEKDIGSTFWIDMNIVQNRGVSEGNGTEIGIVADNNAQAVVRTILYVEDNPVNMLLVEKLINRTEEFELLKAFTPEEGIELARTHKIDLFLLDINLPGMSGYDLLTYFRKQPNTKNIKAIALSANAMVSDIQQGKDSGFDDYITKPIVINEFIGKLKSVVN